jgi:hypothetical protein
MKLTFSTGITVTVKPPSAAKALWLAARLMPQAALPEQLPEAAARPLYERMARPFSAVLPNNADDLQGARMSGRSVACRERWKMRTA